MPEKKKQPKKPPANKPAKSSGKRVKSLAFFVLLALFTIYAFKVSEQLSPAAVSLAYPEFAKLVKSENLRISRAWVEKNSQGVKFRGKISQADLADPAYRKQLEDVVHLPVAADKDFVFSTFLPQITQDMLNDWEERGIPFEFEPEKTSFLSVFLQMLPWILMILFWIFIFRQMQGGGGAGGGSRGIFSFGKSRARLMAPDLPKTTFEDVAGADEAKIELDEVIDFLKDPKKFQALGGKIPKGVLLLGAPGTGKTLLARAVAGEAGVPFFSMSGSDFVEMFVGVGASRVRDLFDQGKKSAPCIIFIDEIDAVGRHRGAGLGGGHDEREQTLNQLLVEMDGFEPNAGVILIAATNRPDVLDPALLRPGRFDRQIVVDRPDLRGRVGILKVHTKNVPLSKDVDLTIIARGTPGVSGADLANMVNEAALLAARYGQKEVTMLDFEEAKDKVMMGIERRSMLISDKEKKIIAYHEAGHALTGKYCANADPVHKVTIIPRGLALGVTFHLPGEDKHINSKAYYLDEISVLFGGRVAEELVFAEITTGASNDIERATEIARKMICSWGMSDRMGPISYGKKEEQIFLGREIAQHRDYSEETAQAIDAEVKHLLETQLAFTRKVLTENIDKLHALALAVLEHEYLDSEEIAKVLDGNKLETTRKPRVMPERRKKKQGAVENADPAATGAAAGASETPAEEDAGKGTKIDTQA